jgi:rsbT co-antagonist protein RsbR
MAEKRQGDAAEIREQDLEVLIESIRRIQSGEHSHRCEADFENPLLEQLRDAVNGLASNFDDFYNSSMELAMGLSECFEVLSAVQRNDLTARVSAATLACGEPMLESFGKTLNVTVADLQKEYGEVARYHEYSMEMAMGLSECFSVLAEVRTGNLTARVTHETLNSSEELVAKLGKSLNDAMIELQSQMELIRHQQLAIEELSTPILNLWDDVLAIPIIGVVDTRRTTSIMEKLLSEIVRQQCRFVIMDITGVDMVDTKTADYFVRIIKAASLLGAHCLLTGIRPAVAQTLVEIGVDLSGITTLRTLRDGLRTCMRQMTPGEEPESQVEATERT